METGRDTKPGDHVQGDRQQHVGEPDVMSHSIATALPMSDETLVDVAPSPPRSRLPAGGQWVVGLLVVRPGVLAGRVVGAGHPAAGQADHKGRPAVRAVLAVPAMIRLGCYRLEPVEVLTVRC